MITGSDKPYRIDIVSYRIVPVRRPDPHFRRRIPNRRSRRSKSDSFSSSREESPAIGPAKDLRRSDCGNIWITTE